MLASVVISLILHHPSHERPYQFEWIVTTPTSLPEPTKVRSQVGVNKNRQVVHEIGICFVVKVPDETPPVGLYLRLPKIKRPLRGLCCDEVHLPRVFLKKPLNSIERLFQVAGAVVPVSVVVDDLYIVWRFS